MLDLRPVCEHCNRDLPPNATNAMICSFECTFCFDCAIGALENVCPNCGGGFAPRPIRPVNNLRGDNYLGKHPPTQKIILKPVDLEAHQRFAQSLKTIAPEHR